MKKNCLYALCVITLSFVCIFSSISSAGYWVELTRDTFEAGWGNYTMSGGTNCIRYSGGVHSVGTYSADIQSYGTSAFFSHTNGIDVHTPGYTQIKVDFWFKAVSLETGEDFWVQYYNGTAWQTVADYNSGTEFVNDQTYPNTIVIINESSYNFPTNMKIRFTCDASNANDDVYIDEIVVSGWVDAPDTNAPTPNPATFSSIPYVTSTTSISMTATIGTDSSGPIEYRFVETSGNPGATSSGWQTSTSYTDSGLSEGTLYTYTVAMRDSLLNTGAASSGYSATTRVTVPDVTSLDQATAEATVLLAGLAVGSITSSFSNTVALGDVISQIPTAGTELPSGSSVNLNVSKGTAVTDFEDLMVFAANWLDTNCGVCNDQDYSGDNDVNLQDYAFFARKWLLEPPATLVINEFMASNDTILQDPDEPGEYPDWIEIYNYGTESVIMDGMRLADSANTYIIPSGVSITAGQYLVFYADDDTEQGPLHTNFKLDASSDEIKLYGTDGVTLIDSITYRAAQAADISHGRYPDNTADWYNMDTPTPEAENQAGMAGEVWFSKLSGTFTADFLLTLSTTSSTAQIRYTTTGSIPTSSSTLYSSPINIATGQTRIIRARTFDTGLTAGPVASQTYLPLAADVQNFSSNLPIVIVDTAGFNIDTENDPAIDYALRPVSSAFIDINDTGRANVTDLADFSGRGGLKVRGDSSASSWVGVTNWPAKQYSFETWDEDNTNKSFSILGFPEESNWVLHIPYDDKSLMRNVLAYKWSNAMGNYASRTKYVELFLNKNGGNVSMSDYWGVYIFMERIKVDKNRVDIAKLQPADSNEPEISGGYIIKHDKYYSPETGFNTTQDRTGWRPFLFHDPKYYEITTGQKAWIKGYLDAFETALYGGSYTDPVNGYARYIDVNTFIDFFWMVELTKQVDSYVYSTYMHKDRNGKLKMGPVWDFNIAFGNAGPTPGQSWYSAAQRETLGWYYSGAGEINVWYNRLRTDAEYNLKCADRWFELREDRLSDANVIADIDSYYNLLSAEAASRHFNRWQLYVSPTTGMEVGSGGVWASILNAWTWPNWYYGTPNNPHTYQMEVEWTKNWLTGLGTPAPGETYDPLYTDRFGWIDNNIGYAFPPTFTVGGVAMNQGGQVSGGSSLTMTGSTGTIYYTTDGIDPRGTGGTVVGTAYTVPITLNASVQVKARIKNGTSWSVLNTATFAVGPVADNLRITEIMYHPTDPNGEFIEVQNIGASAINLAWVKFTDGIEFTFPNLTLGAGQYAVVVRDQAVFEGLYETTGITIAGQFTGALDNSGEEIVLKDACGVEILDFDYNDNWYPITDGSGFSLNIINASNPDRNSWDNKDSWQASSVANGSPGSANPANVAANGAIVINEIRTHSDSAPNDWIELYNTTATTVDIGGWFLSDDPADLKKYQIAAGQTILPYGYKVFTQDANFGTSAPDSGRLVGFGFSELGEQVYLSSGTGGNLSGGYSVWEEFEAAELNVSFGRYTKSALANYEVDFVLLQSLTSGSANSGPLVPGVVFNEIMYNPSITHDQLGEYIELKNPTGAAIVLYDAANPSNTWKFTKGIDYTFPTGISIPAGGVILVVRTTPAVFRAINPSVPAGVGVYGPFIDSELENDGEKVELSRPSTPEPGGFVPYIRVEQVNYSDGTHPVGADPWPVSADGDGQSLNRVSVSSYSNDVSNWTVADPTPGQ